MKKAELIGEKELRKAFERQEDLVVRRGKAAVEAGCFLILNDAKINSSVVSSDLRKSLASKVNVSVKGIEGEVGTNKEYAPCVEYGTRPHMPPVKALETAANVYGIDAWALAMTIKKKGTKAHPYLRPAFDENKERAYNEIKTVLNQLIKDFRK